MFIQAVPVSKRLGLNIYSLHNHANVHYWVSLYCSAVFLKFIDFYQPENHLNSETEWLQQPEQVSRAVCTDMITVSYWGRLWGHWASYHSQLFLIGAACNKMRGWTARGLQLFFIYYTWCFQNGVLHKLRQCFNAMEPASAAVQATSFHPLLPLSLPREREMSQLDSNQRKKEGEKEALWRVLTYSLWDHFKDRLTKITAEGNPVKSQRQRIFKVFALDCYLWMFDHKRCHVGLFSQTI